MAVQSGRSAQWTHNWNLFWPFCVQKNPHVILRPDNFFLEVGAQISAQNGATFCRYFPGRNIASREISQMLGLAGVCQKILVDHPDRRSQREASLRCREKGRCVCLEMSRARGGERPKGMAKRSESYLSINSHSPYCRQTGVFLRLWIRIDLVSCDQTNERN